MNKKTIKIYADIQTQNNESKENLNVTDASCGTGGACGCDCGSSGGDSLETVIKKFKNDYSDHYEVELINPLHEQKESMMKSLNDILKNAGERLVIKRSTYDFTLLKLLPLIVEGDSIVSVGNIPTSTEIHNAVLSGSRISAKAGCC